MHLTDYFCVSLKWQPCKNKLSRQHTWKTPTRDRKRVGYLQISYQYHLSPRCHLGFLRGPVDRGLHRCCHGTSCKMRADYTRSMYTSRLHHCTAYTNITHNDFTHTNFVFYSPQKPSLQLKQMSKQSIKLINSK
jgi:hypothetical protein